MTTAYLIHTNAYDCWAIPATGAVVPVDRTDGESWRAFLAGDCGNFTSWSGGAGWGAEPGFDPYEQGAVMAIRDDAKGAAEIVDADLLRDRAEFFGFAA